MQNTPAARPRPPLLWLLGLVLVLHLWLLAQPLPGANSPTRSDTAATDGPTTALRTRTIAAPAPHPPTPAPHATVAPHRARAPSPHTAAASHVPGPTTPAPAAASAPVSLPAPSPPASTETRPAAATPAAEPDLAPNTAPPTDAATQLPRDTSPTNTTPPTAPPENTTATDTTPQPTSDRSLRVVLPAPSRLKYDVAGTVRGLNYSAHGELLWRPAGGDQEYEARLEIGIFLLGSRVQTSRGRITEQGLAPRRFSDKARSEVAAHFERDKGKVIFSANTPSVDLQPDAQDQLSIFIQLAGLLAGQPERYAPGTRLSLQAVGARDAPVWQFVVDGPEQLHLPGGTLTTLKLTRPPSQAYDVKAELWLAPQLGYLPARIRLTQDNGDFVDQQWTRAEAP